MDREGIKPGDKFGLLTVISFAGRGKDRHSLWLCKCICGKEKIIWQTSLISGSTVSCGCYRRNMGVGKKHGLSNTRIYNIWNQMRHRCFDQSHISYPYYGGKGIVVCEEWAESFDKFKEWALLNGYADNLTIDRKDNCGNYQPDNCRWITQKDNNNNRGVTRVITIDGVTKTVKEWANEYGLKYETLLNRVKRGVTPDNLLKKYIGGAGRDEKGRYCSNGTRAGIG